MREGEREREREGERGGEGEREREREIKKKPTQSSLVNRIVLVFRGHQIRRPGPF
jgi:hypothetical protein